MPAGQNYQGAGYVLDPEVHDGLITYNAGVASKTPNPVTPAMPGSGTSATNTFSYNVNVYISGGSGTVTTVAINPGTTGGGTVATVGNSTVMLKPGDVITVTYGTGGAAPTWYWQAE